MRSVIEYLAVTHHGLAVEDEPLLADLARGFHDPRIAIGPVVTASCDQADAVAVPLQPEPVAVLFDLMEPVGAVWDGGGFGGEAELKRAEHTA